MIENRDDRADMFDSATVGYLNTDAPVMMIEIVSHNGVVQTEQGPRVNPDVEAYVRYMAETDPVALVNMTHTEIDLNAITWVKSQISRKIL